MDRAEAYRAAIFGDYRTLTELLPGLATPETSDGRVWKAAYETRLSLADPRFQPVDSRELSRLSSRTPELVESIRTDAVMRALLRLDGRELVELAAVTAEGSLDALHASAWALLFSDETLDDEPVATVIARASDEQRPDLLILGTALSAMGALGGGDLPTATERARRASRMARTEGMLTCEYVANTVLARTRRHGGMPHLAARILGALSRVVPPPLRAWIAWERALLGDVWPESTSDPALAPSVDLHKLLQAVELADHAAVRDITTALAKKTDPVSFVRRELAIIGAAVNHEEPSADDAEVDSWLAGVGDSIPPELTGLCMPQVNAEGDELAGAFALLGPERTPRRVLRAGVRLGGGEAPEPTPRAQYRTLVALVVLAFAGEEGLSDDALFSQVYGFSLSGPRHAATLRQLVHRMRDYLGGRGAIPRTGRGYAFTAKATFAVPDPRCSPGLDELILRYLGDHDGRATSQDVAQALGIAVRTVQVALKRLVGDGVCTAIRQGRKFDYALEDTTFREPTLTRLSPVV
ncbi:MAG: winged helix-turn-helix domain-containing protein [Myxococcota bacterium]